MKKRTLVHYILFVALIVSLAACAAPQKAFRGNENSPFTRIEPLRVDPNAIQSMSPQEFDEYMRRLRTYNNYVRDTAYANGYYGYSEKQWVNDEEGGPPSPPNAQKASGRSGGGSKKPTIASEAAKTVQRETSNIVRDTMQTTSRELRNEIKNVIRDMFR